MGNLVIILLLGIITLLGSTLSKVLADEFKAWRPTLVFKVIALAAALMGEKDQERYQEEWSAYVDETPGDLSKLLCACEFVFAAFRMSDRRYITMGTKRVMDIAFSIFALIVVAPILLSAMALLRLQGAGPVFVTDRRIGRHGKPFLLYRLQTFRNADGPSRERTRFGTRLNMLSIDQLPQFFNVLKGDMSVVGPRPLPDMPVTGEDDEAILRARQRVRPGLTGLGQVLCNGGRLPSLEATLVSDMLYVAQHSIALDVGIVMKTVFAVRQPREGNLASCLFVALVSLGPVAGVLLLVLLSVFS